MAYDRITLQQLAETRLAEANVLFANGQPSGAYYLAGYAVELALKVPIAATFAANEIPDRAFVNAIYTHDLERLVTHAGLLPELRRRQQDNAEFATNWEVAKNWNEGARYRLIDDDEASALIEAVSNPDAGVFPWIRTFW